MKTIIDVRELENDVLEVQYLDNYPVIEGNKVIWHTIMPINLQEGTLGKLTDSGDVEELKIIKEQVSLDKAMRMKLLDQNNWYQVMTESGQEMLFPPNVLDQL